MRIHLHKTGRGPIAWGILTRGKDDAIRWALLALPASGRKRRMVQQWVKANREDALRMKNKLQQERLEPVLQLD